MLDERDGSHLQFVCWQALVRFAHSVVPFSENELAPMEETGIGVKALSHNRHVAIKYAHLTELISRIVNFTSEKPQIEEGDYEDLLTGK